MEDLKNIERIDGFDFQLDKEASWYECRGELTFDEEHDETPEAGLYDAADKLAKKLRANGYTAEYGYSEKGWVEVTFIKNTNYSYGTK